jgi:hypothetical protein
MKECIAGIYKSRRIIFVVSEVFLILPSYEKLLADESANNLYVRRQRIHQSKIRCIRFRMSIKYSRIHIRAYSNE